MKSTPITKSIIIPFFNGTNHLHIFWESMLPVIDENTEVIMVDDGSSQDIYSAMPGVRNNERVKIIVNDHSLGFAKSVNIGLKQSKGEFIFIVNSDLIINRLCLEAMINKLTQNPNAGIVGATLLYPQTNGIQHAGIAFSETNHFHIYRHAPLHSYKIMNDHSFQAVAFALVCIPRMAFVKVGYLNENYYNSYEDFDYCFRLKENGYDILVDSNAVAYHWERQSGPIRRVMRKDNIARLWRDWGNKIIPDHLDYIRDAITNFHDAENLRSSVKYTILELSRGKESSKIVDLLINGCDFILVNDHWKFNQRNNHNDTHWLPQILPTGSFQHSFPFIYLVDEFPQLLENSYWFIQRKRIISQELIIDANGNILFLNDLYPT
jgi:GT2 family glycosyltransferase